jgi:hypothetical protein
MNGTETVQLRIRYPSWLLHRGSAFFTIIKQALKHGLVHRSYPKDTVPASGKAATLRLRWLGASARSPAVAEFLEKESWQSLLKLLRDSLILQFRLM